MFKMSQFESVAEARWTKTARYSEYSKAANPIGHQTSRVPYADFPSRLHEEDPTRIVPFDLGDRLRWPGPATSPVVCAKADAPRFEPTLYQVVPRSHWVQQRYLRGDRPVGMAGGKPGRCAGYQLRQAGSLGPQVPASGRFHHGRQGVGRASLGSSEGGRS
jgi:hypothetical protein